MLLLVAPPVVVQVYHARLLQVPAAQAVPGAPEQQHEQQDQPQAQHGASDQQHLVTQAAGRCQMSLSWHEKQRVRQPEQVGLHDRYQSA